MRIRAAYDLAPKRDTNLSINSVLPKMTRELDINLSATLKRALTGAVKGRQLDRCLAENRNAIVSIGYCRANSLLSISHGIN